MKKKVYIVDDDLDTVKGFKTILLKMGYLVKTNYTGENVIEAIRKGKFDLVLLDMILPNTSGRDLLKEKVAFLTVVPLDILDQDALDKLKPIAYIEKPAFKLDEFIALIGELSK